jgi:serine/threonine protein kinase
MDKMSVLCGGKYKILKKLGQGKFGRVYQGLAIKSGDIVALKIDTSKLGIIKHEAFILNYLGSGRVLHASIPKLYWFGIYYQFPCIVIPYFDGGTLEDRLHTSSTSSTSSAETFDYRTVMKALIDVLTYIHSKYVVHRDIKPENIIFKNNDIFLVDFGLATFYTDDAGCHLFTNHIRNHMVGTPTYASLHVHEGMNPRPCDDMISLGYVLMKLVMGTLPWENLEMEEDREHSMIELNHTRNREIQSQKQWSNIMELCRMENSLFIYFTELQKTIE